MIKHVAILKHLKVRRTEFCSKFALGGFGNFLVILSNFFPCEKGPKSILMISHNTVFSQKSDDLNRFLVKFSF